MGQCAGRVRELGSFHVHVLRRNRCGGPRSDRFDSISDGRPDVRRGIDDYLHVDDVGRLSSGLPTARLGQRDIQQRDDPDPRWRDGGDIGHVDPAGSRGQPCGVPSRRGRSVGLARLRRSDLQLHGADDDATTAPLVLRNPHCGPDRARPRGVPHIRPGPRPEKGETTAVCADPAARADWSGEHGGHDESVPAMPHDRQRGRRDVLEGPGGRT